MASSTVESVTAEAVEQVIALTERDDVRDQQDALRRERKEVEKRIARLVAAVETGGDVPSLVATVQEMEARRTTIDRDLTMLCPVPRLAPTVIEDRLAEWRRLLRQSTTQGRAVLQRVLKGRIVFTRISDLAVVPWRPDRLLVPDFVGLPRACTARRR